MRGKSYKFYVDRGVFSKSGVDFGSKLLIESFRVSNVSGPIADIGCGWGPIGISIASDLWDREVVMVDINERAVELANMNASLNGLTNVQVYQKDLLDGFKEDSFASIVTNPPIRAGKKVIFKLYEQSVKALKNGGELWVVIQKKQGAPSTEKKLLELGLEVDIVKKEKGYFIIKGKKFDSRF